MEHRCTERFSSDLKIIIYKHDLPIAIGRIKDGSRWGIFVETDSANVECERPLTLEVLLDRKRPSKLKHIEVKAMVIYKTARGFGAELDIETQEDANLFVEMLRGQEILPPHEEQTFAYAANG